MEAIAWTKAQKELVSFVSRRVRDKAVAEDIVHVRFEGPDPVVESGSSDAADLVIETDPTTLFCMASREQSITHPGPTRSRTGMVSVALFGRCRPETQWIGASKWVPVCSLHEKLFQYQAGPRSS